jgi:hypothetical protein
MAGGNLVYTTVIPVESRSADQLWPK